MPFSTPDTQTEHKKLATLTRKQTLIILVCTSAPSFMLQLDANIVAVSLPAIAKSLNASFAGIEWVISAYLLSFASLLLPAGALADRYGRKPLLIIGLLFFTASSFFCGSAPNLPILIAARAFQGAGAAMQLSAALATLSHIFEGEARARAFSFWGAVVGIGIASGPVVGGIITQTLGWEWAFYVNLPIGAALTALVAKNISSSKDPHATRLDIPGVVLFGGSLFLVTLALIDGNHAGWTNRWIVAELIGAAVLLMAFIQAERRQARPMLDMSFFRKPTYLGANLAQFSFAAGMLTMLTLIPIFLQNGLVQTSGIAGLMMLPMVVPLFIVPRIVSQHLAFRFSGRVLLTLGLMLICLGLAWLALVVPDLSYWPMVGGMLLAGIGAGILNGETTKVGMTVIPKERAGMASGVAGTVRFTGLVLGIAILGIVLYSGVSSSLRDSLTYLSEPDRISLVQNITAGHLALAMLPNREPSTMAMIAIMSFANGYRWIFAAGALFMAASALYTWKLVRAADTPPAVRSVKH